MTVLPRILIWVLLLMLGSASASAQTDAGSGTFSVLFENDLFGDTDQHYTSGVKLSWLSPDLRDYRDDERVPDWLQPYAERLLFFDRAGHTDDPLYSRNVILSVGQSIFTPQDLDRFDLIVDDRPYAGWLYAGLGFRRRDPGVMDTLELQLGVVGPASLAEPAQVFIHQLRGLDKPNGWRHQLDNEPTLGIAYERKWRALAADWGQHFGYDLIPHVGASLGNAYVFGSIGAELRLGWNLPRDFGDPLIRPGGVSSPPVVWSTPRQTSLYVFGFIDGRAVGRDLFLDGNSFADSHSVDRRIGVADFALGASLVTGRLKLTLATVLRTREFETQTDNHRFGSITLSYSY